MLKIGDRPMIEHLIEYLAHQKIDEFHIILCHHPDQVENYLGDGKHWGVKIFYHLVRNPNFPFATLQSEIFLENESILVGNVETLPFFDDYLKTNQALLLFYSPSKNWTGWGVF